MGGSGRKSEESEKKVEGERERERRKGIEREGPDSAQCNSTRPLTSVGA